jgi:hypothetical protein
MQDEAMRRRFPSIKLVLDLPWVSIWEGELRPLSAAYGVRIVDHRGADDGRVEFSGRWPSVRVLTPLARREEASQETVPHIYGSHDDPRGADLCLFHPASRDWTDDMLLAESIVPWTAEWLFYYEMWHVTGVWGGPEASHDLPCGVEGGAALASSGRTRRRSIDGSLMRSMPYLLSRSFSQGGQVRHTQASYCLAITQWSPTETVA